MRYKRASFARASYICGTWAPVARNSISQSLCGDASDAPDRRRLSRGAEHACGSVRRTVWTAFIEPEKVADSGTVRAREALYAIAFCFHVVRRSHGYPT